MSGRSKFNKYKWIIMLIYTLLRWLPLFLKKSLWNVTDIFPETLGIVVRYCLLKGLAKNCGDNVFIGKGVEIKGWENMVVGNNVSIHNNCYIDASGGLKIGNNVSIAHQSSILTFEHTWGNNSIPIKYNPVIFDEVTIEDDVWIGCGCRILSGVIISTRTIVAAGAVVTKSTLKNTIVGGVPAKLIKIL